MVLHGEDRQIAVGHPLHRAVVQVAMGDLELGTREGLGLDGEPVVLRRDVHATRAQVLDGLVPAPVAELQLEGPCAERPGEDLVT